MLSTSLNRCRWSMYQLPKRSNVIQQILYVKNYGNNSSHTNQNRYISVQETSGILVRNQEMHQNSNPKKQKSQIHTSVLTDDTRQNDTEVTGAEGLLHLKEFGRTFSKQKKKRNKILINVANIGNMLLPYSLRLN